MLVVGDASTTNNCSPKLDGWCGYSLNKVLTNAVALVLLVPAVACPILNVGEMYHELIGYSASFSQADLKDFW